MADQDSHVDGGSDNQGHQPIVTNTNATDREDTSPNTKTSDFNPWEPFSAEESWDMSAANEAAKIPVVSRGNWADPDPKDSAMTNPGDTDATPAFGKSWPFEEDSSETLQAAETQAKAAEGWEDEQLPSEAGTTQAKAAEGWGDEQPPSEAGATQAEAAEGWGDEQLPGATEPNTNPDAGPPQEADLDYQFTNEDYKSKNQVKRGAHVSILGKDNVSYTEIPGFRGILSDDCVIELWFKLDREASYIELKASFVKDVLSPPEFSELQHMSYRFHEKHIANGNELFFKRIESIEDLVNAPSLRTVPRIQTLIRRKHLHSLTIEFVEGYMIAEGIDDPRSFNQPAKVAAANAFRTIREKTEVTVFVELDGPLVMGGLEKLKKKMFEESKTCKFREYMSREGNPTLIWAHDKFGNISIDTYARQARDTFDSMVDWQLTHGYGADREGQYQIRNLLETADNAMAATFAEWPYDTTTPVTPASTDNDLCKRYLAFLQCDQEELIKLAYNQGTKGVLCFDKPDPKAPSRPVGWQYQIIPALPDAEYNGNLVMVVRRPEGDTRQIPASRFASRNMTENIVWAFPDINDISVRRLINCANKVPELDPLIAPGVTDMHRLLLALDLHDDQPTDILDNITPEQATEVANVVDRMTTSQKRAWEHIRVNGKKIVLLQGPPGTGKTTFATMIVEIFEICKISYEAGAASNVGTDTIASKIFEALPKAGTIRSHGLNTETRSMQSFKAKTPEDVEEPVAEEPIAEEPIAEKSSTSWLHSSLGKLVPVVAGAVILPVVAGAVIASVVAGAVFNSRINGDNTDVSPPATPPSAPVLPQAADSAGSTNTDTSANINDAPSTATTSPPAAGIPQAVNNAGSTNADTTANSKDAPSTAATSSPAPVTPQPAGDTGPSSGEIDEALREAEFLKLLADMSKDNKAWRNVKTMRPNYSQMSLQVRVMQNAGLIRADIPCFKPGLSQKNPHEEFKKMIVRGNSNTWSQEEKKSFVELRNLAIADTINKTNGLITTLSNSDDKVLKACKQAAVCMIDEACQALELEVVLLWLANYDTMRRIILIGDLCQLDPTVTTRHANKPERTTKDGTELPAELVNPFADQAVRTLYERLWHRGVKVYRFLEQHRAAAGLERIYSEMFYDGELVNGPGTLNRPEAEKAKTWIKDNYNIHDDIPHMFLNVPNGVSYTEENSTSKVNPTSALVTVNVVRKMIKDKLWQPSQITIVTPYRAQATRTRRLLRRFKVGTLADQVEVSTVDAMQARENQCIVFDLVVASRRDYRGFGHIIDAKRLCVALSRAQNMFVMVGDITLPDNARGDNAQSLLRHLSACFNHFRLGKMVTLVDPKDMDEFKATKDEDFARTRQIFSEQAGFSCRNCGDFGHKASQCDKPIDKSRPRSKAMGACQHCASFDHESRDCTKKPCFLCGDKTHQKRTCPEIVCGACHAKGHVREDCPVPRSQRRRYELPGKGKVEKIQPLGKDEPIPNTAAGADVRNKWKDVAFNEHLIDEVQPMLRAGAGQEEPAEFTEGKTRRCALSFRVQD
ncbi:MAG: hypothetical protein Q9204_000926 [Flavoplaca sp. TL-2023a]